MMDSAKNKRQQGAALVEFVLVLPLLLLIVFGMIEFSVYMFDKAVVTNASREAAREWIEYRPTKKTFVEIDNVVQQYCQDKLITFDSASPPVTTITPSNPNDVDSNEQVTVRVEYAYSFLFLPNLIKDFPIPPLWAQTTMRAE